jgi:polar amino acid transport system permease protein
MNPSVISGKKPRLSWKERYAHQPWFRRYELLIPALLINIAIMVFVLPPKSLPSGGQWIGIIASYLIYLILTVLILADREKPLWLKNITALGIVFIFGWFFYRYSAARWERMGQIFFNFEIMSKGDFLASGTSLSNWELMRGGLFMALRVFSLSALFGSLLGLFIAVVREVVNDKVLNFFIIAYVDFFRAIPMIVMLLVVYSALPFLGILLSPFVSGIFTLTIIQGAYMSEVFRAGIEAIHHGQTEAAKSIGLSTWKTMRYVILPQALKIVVPPYTGTLVGLMKGTALTSVITIGELLKTAQQVQSWYANPTPIFIATMLYLAILLPMTRLSIILEKKWRAQGARSA